jgi:hypothetical protein
MQHGNWGFKQLRHEKAMKYLASAKRNCPGIIAVCICSAALLAGLSACSKQNVRESMRDMRKSLSKLIANSPEPAKPSQPAKPEPVKTAKAAKPASHAKAPQPVAVVAEPLPEPTQQELIEYLRGKLLALSPNDGFNDNLEVRFDPSSSKLTVIQPTSRCDHFLGALDAGNITWDVFDPSDEHNPRPELLRLSTTAVSGKKARACFDVNGLPEQGTPANRVRLLFSRAKAEEIPDFQAQMAKVVKKLIVLSGGVEAKELFQDSKAKSRSEDK